MNRRTESEPLSIEEWKEKYWDEVFKGPSASLPVNRMCAEIYKSGHLPGTKFDWLEDMGLLKFHAQPNGHPGKGVAELDLEAIAKESGKPQERLHGIANYMEKYGFIP